ncbi:NAD(P)-binding domain-containing protein [Simiduia curdlanivorans]|uniref:NAD(P)-binding domain-containing protein n=1 Tax=Simiduia curdlanivorans TaxID=1492769 RepID=A0ABV8V705_9GAMM|nr:NAD(P)-binding domain-containing protein [Simiduia curdlanivorans]MDN3639033.1 NAD(P)-binding domain-containing protein [Simiduia curdlanivorans]
MQRYQVIVVGAGPAGLSAGLQAARKGLSCLVLESSAAVAGTIRGFTAGKWVMSEPSKLALRSPLPFEAAKREALLADWEAAARDAALELRCNQSVVHLEGEHPSFSLQTQTGEHYHAEHLVLAFGTRGNPNTLAAAGADTVDIHYQVPSQGWQGQRILLVGAGDSALEDALLLSQHNQVLLLNRGQGFPKAKPANRERFQQAVDNNRLRQLDHVRIERLDKKGESLRLHISCDGQARRLVADQLLVRIGSQSPRIALEQWGLNFSGTSQYPMLDEHNQSNRKGLYVIGALSGEALIKPGINQGYNVVQHLCGEPASPIAFEALQHKLFSAGVSLKPAHLLTWLRQQKGFKNLPTRILIRLLEKVSVRRYSVGQVVLKKGQYAESLSLVLQGSAQIGKPSAEAKGLQAGQMFGEFSLLSRRPVSDDITALNQLAVISFPRFQLEAAWSEEPAFWRLLVQIYLSRIIQRKLDQLIPDKLFQLLFQRGQIKNVSRDDSFSLANQVGFIVSGAAQFDCATGQTLVPAGNFIGIEQALGEQPEVGFKSASSQLQLYCLPADELLALLAGNHQQLRQLAQQESQTHQQVKTSVVEFFETEQLANANNILVIDKDKCVGCDNCETACAATHQGISRVNRAQGDVFANAHLPGSCRHCQQAYCMKDCPADAISRAEDGSIQIADTCIGCGNCASFCPFGAIAMARTNDDHWLDKLNPFSAPKLGPTKAVKCDLCQSRIDGPACVQACPTGAAQRMSADQLIPLINVA